MASKLDQVPPAGPRFNSAADSSLEKRLQSHQLTPDERQKVTDLRNECNAKKDQEIQSFAKPEVKNKLRQEKYAEIANRNSHPTPELFPPGMRNRTMSPAQMMSLADVGIRQDHQNRLRGIDKDFDSGVNGILKNANDNGRGPERSTSQEFNRANDNQRTMEMDR